ncbi:MAG: 30S ribosomal protein S20 [Parcubacteria group bacterium RIFCSPLOWO2_01_FULL_40_65]|nr:MAG: 30S ribosomal protein S20 [Parcubacteria group bacterium RIFCSPHIGHO2_01_FULL_40_30]OHB19293.1 MAG: 30S ribosomal protein S20 [Parcubacteria group bacterium RIFCSPHIGHO2_02_FULL_40_12]OHB21044.1 MAG: 30S ribosomal protein S20 [Parcubacteria group bacterium RIFCSPLOWO2_01_FULL_40_65]OHB23365.1 MAG: 30S ribosomal protein S20 [Parcubacteria group bacterium RIFCSPLOWO2_02_FULL_40_12]OHB24492.1 MAG: 30S ribosomal protein S20 [Parcubacteria group bacterium RIFCSPLOWO2_12_FULL_40_10]
MPITESAKKALRQSIARRQKNLRKKEAIKDIIKKVKKLVAQGKTEEAKNLLSQAYKTIDKATKSFLHKRTAARKKSRLTALLSKNSIKV